MELCAGVVPGVLREFMPKKPSFSISFTVWDVRGQDSTAVAILLPEHAGTHLRRRQQ